MQQHLSDRVDHRDLHRLLDAIEKLKEQHEERENEYFKQIQKERKRADTLHLRAESLTSMLDEKDFVVEQERKIAEGERKRAEGLHKVIQEQDKLRQLVEETKQAAETERKERETIARQCESLQQHIEMLREQVKQETDTRRTAEETSTELLQRLTEMESRCLTLHEELRSDKKNLKSKVHELVDVSHELAALGDVHDHTIAQLERVTRTLSNAIRTLGLEDNDKLSLSNNTQSKVAAVRLADSCLALERGVREMMAELEEAPEREEELQRLRKESSNGQKKIQDLTAQHDALEQDNRRLQEQVHTLQQELTQQQNSREKEKTEQRLYESEEEAKRMKGMLEAMQHEALARRAQVEELNRRLAHEKAEKASVDTRHQVLVEELAAAEAKLKRALALSSSETPPSQPTPSGPPPYPHPASRAARESFAPGSSSLSAPLATPSSLFAPSWKADSQPSTAWGPPRAHGYGYGQGSHVTFQDEPQTAPERLGDVSGWEVWRSGDTQVTRTHAAGPPQSHHAHGAQAALGSSSYHGQPRVPDHVGSPAGGYSGAGGIAEQIATLRDRLEGAGGAGVGEESKSGPGVRCWRRWRR